MLRLFIKFIGYGFILWVFTLIGLTPDLSLKPILILAAVLAAVNTLIRPLFVAIALPFNLLTFGIASVFANLLSLVIANAISGKPLHGFWVMLLLSFIIMLVDDSNRITRNRIKRRMAHRML